MFQLDPKELNNTRKAKKDVLFFNRVPKVGSQVNFGPHCNNLNHFDVHILLSDCDGTFENAQPQK